MQQIDRLNISKCSLNLKNFEWVKRDLFLENKHFEMLFHIDSKK